MDKLTHEEIAKRLGWKSRQVLEYWINKKRGSVPLEKALAIQKASMGQIRAKDLCNGIKKTALEALKGT